LLADHRSTPTRPRRPEVVVAAGILAMCAGVVAGFAWSRPTMATSVLAYTQSGRLSYSAPTSATSVYGHAGLVTGDPIYADAVHRVTVSYAYDLSAAEPTAVSGSEQLVATMTNGEGLTRTIPLQQKSAFTGGHFNAIGILNLDALQSAANAFQVASGTIGSESFVVSISPEVSVHGRVGDEQLATTFGQPVSFTYTSGVGGTSANLIPGTASQGVAGESSAAGSAVAPSTFAASTRGFIDVPHGSAATLPLGLGVAKARLISLVVLAVALLAAVIFGRRLVGDATSKDERVRIATRYGTSLVDVEELPGPPGIVLVELSSFDGLREVARRLECPVLHQVASGPELHESDVYAVVDSGTLYRYATERATAKSRKSGRSIETPSRANPAHKRLETASTIRIEHVPNGVAAESGASVAGLSSNGDGNHA
jgi:hypothetical protein